MKVLNARLATVAVLLGIVLVAYLSLTGDGHSEAVQAVQPVQPVQSQSQQFGPRGAGLSIVDIPYDGGDGRCPASAGEIVTMHDANGGCELIDLNGNYVWVNHNNGRSGLMCDHVYISKSLRWFYSLPQPNPVATPSPGYFESQQWLNDNRCTDEQIEIIKGHVQEMIDAEEGEGPLYKHVWL